MLPRTQDFMRFQYVHNPEKVYIISCYFLTVNHSIFGIHYYRDTACEKILFSDHVLIATSLSVS